MTQPSGVRYTLPWSDGRPPLGRHVNHDPRSLAYAHPVLPRFALAPQSWTRRCPVLDQGTVGSCVGNAAAGWVGTDNAARPGRVDVDEALAVQLYAAATGLDQYAGAYPPDDTGSDGVSGSKALQQGGYCTGYTHGFLVQALASALQTGPALIGVSWYESQFTPAGDGQIPVDVHSGLAGGHELVVDQYEPGPTSARDRYWVTNSWGTSWGVAGRGYFTGADLTVLLADDGDVTVPTAGVAPTPTPPAGDADTVLAGDARPWIARHHTGAANRHMSDALRDWLVSKGL